jgi:glycosyltransferase involved in cell wall biosynthesis
MKIGIDARLTHYRPGGIAEYTRHLIQELAALDRSTGFCVIHHPRAQETLAPAPNFRRVHAYTPSHHRLERWSLSLELARHHLDLLHSPDMIPPLRGARRHVITVHDLHFLHYPQFMTADSHRYYNAQIAWAVRAADHILVDSSATRDDLGNLLDVPVARMTVHMLGVDERFRPLPAAEVAQSRARLGLPDCYLLFVGTFEPRKNIPGLLDAYARLCRTMPDAPPLVLAGRRGWLYEDIFAKASALNLGGRLIWMENPPASDLPALYSGAAALLLPSYYEGFGLPALEAMACGTPAIVANRGSLPEVVGEAGVLIDPDDPAGIAAAAQSLLQDTQRRDQLRTAGIARAASFTWRKTAEIAHRVYLEVLSQSQ